MLSHNKFPILHSLANLLLALSIIYAPVFILSALMGGISWFFAPVLYLMIGIQLLWHDKRIVKYDRPLYVNDPIFVKAIWVILWPIRLYTIFQEFVFMRNVPDRFYVLYGSLTLSSKTNEFSRKKEAISFAKEKAREYNSIVKIYDKALKKEYTIYPSGESGVYF